MGSISIIGYNDPDWVFVFETIPTLVEGIEFVVFDVELLGKGVRLESDGNLKSL